VDVADAELFEVVEMMLHAPDRAREAIHVKT